MVEEKPTKEEVKPTKEEEKKTFLKEIKDERLALTTEREMMEKVMSEAKEIKAFETISGKTDAGQPQEKKEEESPVDYAKRLLSGKFKLDAD